jgi:hypothetical protein
MLHRVLEKTEHLEVVQELSSREELPSAIARLDPEWVILSEPYHQDSHSWLHNCIADHPSVRFMFLSPESNTIKVMWQTTYEEELINLSLKGFVDIFERDLQHS